jgi:predicted phage tail protein
MTMTTIKLSGSLAQRFFRKREFLLETGTAQEAFSALKHTVDGFEDFIRDQARLGMRYAIFRNRENVGVDRLTMSGTTEIRIVPVIAGSKSSLMQVVSGIVLIVAGAFITTLSFGGAAPIGGALIGMGVGMVLGGVAQMLSPTPKTQNQEDQGATENKPSYLFNGAFNSTQQGLPVPVVYGQMLVGSSVIAVGTWAEAIPA